MGLDAITVTFTSFEKLEILRGELKACEEHLQKVEKELRDAMRSLATHRYLKSVSSYYASRPTPPEAATVREVEKRRQALYQVIQEIRAEIPRLEVAGPGQGQPTPRQGGRRSRFV
jgi:hypothetical protein